MTRSIAEGTTQAAFVKELTPVLRKLGWKPPTGVDSIPWRLKRIFDTNMRSAYAAGQWARISDSRRPVPPYLLYGLGPAGGD